MTDTELAERIREDKIDILVDLSGHTAYNRLPVFALRPVPIQVTWIGYFHSTGLESIDYFITDPYTSPPGSGQFFSETPVHLPHTRFCYLPPDYAPEVASPPFEKNGYITFGSFNRLPKLVDPVVRAWALILIAIPDARLVIKAGALHEEETQIRLLDRFAVFGITKERIILRPVSPHRDMLTEYGDIDIALDPFPFNGGMTTMEALWMGVPVLTIAGDSVVSRQTFSVLSNIGLASELAFPNIETYIKGAVALAKHSERLSRLRQELRPRMAASPLRNAEQFARDLENLYRRMWRTWCEGNRLPSDL